MTTEVLKKKTARYLCGESVPAEKKQIQNWLSCIPEEKKAVSIEERALIEEEIMSQIHAYVICSSFQPESAPWWKKITAFF